jgi:hypothetical protein
MQDLDAECYEEALVIHGMSITWSNIENNLRETDSRYKISRYQKETFQRVLNENR